MEITQATHKNLLYKLFFAETPTGLRPKQFPIDKLLIANGAAKKLLEGSERTENSIEFKDGGVKFTPDEWVFLKDLLKQKTTGEINEAEIIQELKELFDREEQKPTE